MKRYVNLAVTVAAVAATVLPALAGGPRAWWVLPLAVASSVPVLWRDRALLTVAAVVGLATTVSASLGAPPLLPVGPLVCLYTFAARAALPIRLLGILLTAGGLLFSLLYPHPDVEVLRYLVVAYSFSYALGTSARARRTQAMALAERDRRVAGERAAAVLRERARIARDLHDILTHAVGVMIVQAEAGPLLVRPHPDRADAAFATIAATGRDAVVQLRRAVGSLHEPADQSLDQPGLAHLPVLVERVRATGLDAVLTVSPPPCGSVAGPRSEVTSGPPVGGALGWPFEPPADVGIAAYRIVQESLTNVVRHAEARTVRILLSYSADALTVSITDDGRGNRAFGAGVPGYGIVGMRERARACGGTLRTGPASDSHGFTVTATLPLSAPAAV
ncbi:sensor histidine kinase [Micromonospora sp. MH99]|uniref:sensor histidine kinase n=1 Tax=Micromonospora sp. MH99 TaxID=1945510 RepID=UPI001F193696|nr:histidine kinase [Micromonospora sp. MH99]